MSLYTDFDHYDLPVGQDGSPVAFFESLRDEAVQTETPIGWSERHGGFWVVAGFQAGREIMHNNECFSNHGITLPRYGTPDDTPIMLAGMDEPEHKKYRRIIQQPFSAKNARSLDAPLRAATNDLIDGFIEEGRIDLAYSLTNAVPARLTALLLGLPAEDGDVYLSWVDAMVHGIPSGVEGAADKVAEMEAFFSELLKDRRRNLGDDLLSLILQAESEGERLGDQAVKDFFVLLLMGGIDNTSKLLGTMFWRLSWDKELRRKMVDDPDAMRIAWDEFLRYYSSVMAGREVTKPIEIGGVKMEPGQAVFMVHPVMNRDPDEFTDPDVFKPARNPNRHLALGLGIHRCLGAHLLRVEAQVVAEEYFKRIPVWELDPSATAQWKHGQSYGMQSIPVVFPPGGGEPDADWTPDTSMRTAVTTAQ